VNEPFDYGSGTVAGRNKEKLFPLRLDQNFPNPFNPVTSISFTLPESGLVRLEVFDALGQTVGVLADEWRSQGRHLVAWNAAKCPSGIYFYRLLFNGQVTTKSMLLVR
jgi:hypothetical protein